MDLSLISDSELMSRLGKLVRTERKITHVILWHIVEVEERRLYATQGYDSMFSYLTKCLGYGEDSAYRRLSSARLLKKVPEVADKIETGAITLTQLTQVQKCIKTDKKSGRETSAEQTLRVIEEIGHKTSMETQRILAVEFNQPIVQHENIRIQRDLSTRLELTFTEEQMAVLSKARDLLSHSLPQGNWAELFVHLAQKQVRKIEGAARSRRINYDGEVVSVSEDNRPEAQCEPRDGNIENQNEVGANRDSGLISTRHFLAKRKRAGIKISTRRKVMELARHKCEYSGDHTCCNSSFQLQIDHRLPISLGGTDSIENLRVLCRTHNLSEAKRMGVARTNAQAGK
ncbi:HNH endonuclease [Bdellovibrio sp. HCB209]|uniref:HNH endonuclease n=1 Tax=Bdellovibrio sp. HCB209 TaxID=3394354 RepID=UPI0039B3CF4B